MLVDDVWEAVITHLEFSCVCGVESGLFSDVRWFSRLGRGFFREQVFFFCFGELTWSWPSSTPTAVGYPPTAVGCSPTAVCYPLSAIGWSCADFAGYQTHLLFFFLN